MANNRTEMSKQMLASNIGTAECPDCMHGEDTLDKEIYGYSKDDYFQILEFERGIGYKETRTIS